MRNMNFFGLENLANVPLTDIPSKDKDFVDQSELNKVCELVYAVNERTKLPTGDLNVLFSDKVPQDISDWVKRNLQAPIDVGGQRSIYEGKEVDDETILACVRERNESQIDYINRMDSLLRKLYSDNQEGN